MKRTCSIFISIFALLLLTNCFIFRNPVEGEKVLKLYKDREGNVNITGDLKIKDLQKRPSFSEWYMTEYNNYVVNIPKTQKRWLKNLFINRSVQIFMGTWCEDSKREVPRFMKIMDYLDIPKSKIQLIGINDQKHAFSGQDFGKRIQYVPTFIFYHNEFADETPTEIGRIVERPVETLEKDLLKILSGDAYVPNYAGQ
ncbi:MAG: thioredoxin [Flavobacteriales bacterium]